MEYTEGSASDPGGVADEVAGVDGDGGAAKRIRVEVEGADGTATTIVTTTEGGDDNDQVTATVIGEIQTNCRCCRILRPLVGL